MSNKDFQTKNPEKFNTIQEALQRMQSRFRIPIEEFKSRSVLLKEYKMQTRLGKWF